MFKLFFAVFLMLGCSACSPIAMMKSFTFDYYVSDKAFMHFDCDELLIFEYDVLQGNYGPFSRMTGLNYYTHDIPNYVAESIIENSRKSLSDAIDKKSCSSEG
jgi:hypothetical protein